MTPRAIRKTSLAIGDATVPVKLYRAVEEHDVHFRLLHVEDLAPVKQRMVDPRSGEAVASEAIQRGVAVGDGVFVVVKPEEVEREAPKPSRTIELIRFVPPRAIDPAWYERPYVLGPRRLQRRVCGTRRRRAPRRGCWARSSAAECFGTGNL